MKFFNFGKKDKILDLTERCRKQQERTTQIKEDFQNNSQPSQELPSQNPFGFFGNLASSNSSQSDSTNVDEDKKKKFAKRLIDLTNKIEELSNQIYHLQQRVELLEKKTQIGNY
jgi:hypothetical protein